VWTRLSRRAVHSGTYLSEGRPPAQQDISVDSARTRGKLDMSLRAGVGLEPENGPFDRASMAVPPPKKLTGSIDGRVVTPPNGAFQGSLVAATSRPVHGHRFQR
jgi:hypothetical protein